MKEKKKQATINQKSDHNRIVSDHNPETITFTFKDFDKFLEPGQTFKQWKDANLILNLFDILVEYSDRTIPEAKKGKLTTYGKWPPDSQFPCPTHLDKTLDWGTIRIQGKERIAGYRTDSVFHIVFLDKDHLFWPSEKKNT
jgi:hypothetical protein